MYGFLISDYHPKRFYWDIFENMYKVLIIIGINTFEENIISKNLVSIFVLIGYFIVAIRI